jgi:hypothetical protein
MQPKLSDKPTKPAEKCRWFLNCTRDAVTSVKHPVLGDVPCCKKCAKFATEK